MRACGVWEREEEEEEEEEYLSKAFLTRDALVQSPSLERVCVRAKKRAKKASYPKGGPVKGEGT